MRGRQIMKVIHIPRATAQQILTLRTFSTTPLIHKNRLVEKNYDLSEQDTLGQADHSFTSSVKMSQESQRYDLNEKTKARYQSQTAATVNDPHIEVFNQSPAVSLKGCMQSNVPHPYSKSPTHMNMPGGLDRGRENKYTQGKLGDLMKRYFTTKTVPGTTTPVPLLDEHGNIMYTPTDLINAPCAQGVQGDDCAAFKLWLNNCINSGNTSHEECEQLANEYIAGRKTLVQIFSELDSDIRSVKTSQTKNVSSSSPASHDKLPSEGNAPDSNSNSGASSPGSSERPAVTRRKEQLKRLSAAVRDYGSTVVLFHVTISLASLGAFYLLVSSNVDMSAIINFFGINLGDQATNARNASNFVVAYAVHKVFAPARIAITLTCAPIIVRALRARGILKSPKL